MYYICLIVPAFADTLEEEEKRKQAFRKWSEESFKPKIRELLGNGNFKIELLLGFTGSIDEVSSLEMSYKGITPKGLIIRGKMLSIINKLDVAEREESFIILIDGSGKIEYNCVLSVIKALVHGENIILGCRHSASYGIKDDRKNIELFENFIVSEKFKIKLPDAQCGCWGLRTNLLKKISLTANGYEIELDLLVSALDSSLDICYFPVKIVEEATKISSFTPEQHINKLIFLLNKLSFDEFILKALYEKFIVKFEIPLPESYVADFKKINLDYHKNNPRCYYGCDRPCTEIVNPSFEQDKQIPIN